MTEEPRQGRIDKEEMVTKKRNSRINEISTESLNSPCFNKDKIESTEFYITPILSRLDNADEDSKQESPRCTMDRRCNKSFDSNQKMLRRIFQIHEETEGFL